MCPPPCGPKNRSSKRFIKSETITKCEVDDIIASGNFICSYRMGDEIDNHDYVGCLHNLHMILHDAATKVRVVGSRSKDYLEGYRTIVMRAPCFPATFIIREYN